MTQGTKKRDEMPTISPLQALFWPESAWLRRENRLKKVKRDLEKLKEHLKKIETKEPKQN